MFPVCYFIFKLFIVKIVEDDWDWGWVIGVSVWSLFGYGSLISALVMCSMGVILKKLGKVSSKPPKWL